MPTDVIKGKNYLLSLGIHGETVSIDATLSVFCVRKCQCQPTGSAFGGLEEAWNVVALSR